MEINNFTLLFFAAMAINIGIHLWLSRRHIKHILAHREQVPSAFLDSIPLDAHQKAADYTIALQRFGVFELFLGALFLLIWTVGGGLDLLDRFWRGFGWSAISTGVAVMISAFAIMAILDIPSSLYRTFVIEERFGFNRTTFRTWLSDLIKSALLMLVIGVPLLWLVLWLMENMGEYWWLYVWAVWMGFSLFMMWAYPTFIAPLFNTFEPLTDEELRSRIENLLQRNGFSSKGIFIVDGSRRSSHGNAYFTGFGSNKRIVFYDTLIDDLEAEEIEAVLAHELGHFKRKHIIKQVTFMSVISLGGLALLGWLMKQDWFYHGLGVSQPSIYMALLLFLMVSPIFSFFLGPLMAWTSRKFEFEADEYASRHSDAKKLIRALVKLYRENANTLTPDPLYSAFHDSHPPAPVRIKHLEKLSSHGGIKKDGTQ